MQSVRSIDGTSRGRCQCTTRFGMVRLQPETLSPQKIYMTYSTSALSRTLLSSALLIGGLMLVLAVAMPLQAQAASITMQLEIGMTHPQVGTLQTFLARDPAIYPQGLVTNYFGFLTKSAVSNFQSRNGIDAIGRVGPITMAAINAQMGGVVVSDTTEGAGKITNVGPAQPILTNLGVTFTNNSATVTWNSNVAATARVMYSTTWPFMYQPAASATGSTGSFAQSVTLNNLQSNTRYYFVAESLDSQGNFSWSTNGMSFKTN